MNLAIQFNKFMKTYTVYINGIPRGLIKAGSRKAAEKKAAKICETSPFFATPSAISVAVKNWWELGEVGVNLINL